MSANRGGADIEPTWPIFPEITERVNLRGEKKMIPLSVRATLCKESSKSASFTPSVSEAAVCTLFF